MNVKVEVQAPRLHYVHPTCFEAGKPMEFIACGTNLLQHKFRYLYFSSLCLLHHIYNSGSDVLAISVYCIMYVMCLRVNKKRYTMSLSTSSF